jgi:hypothetical protein
MTKLVVFDESGNTGADLLNSDQPTFVLASCDFSVDEAEALLRNVSDDRSNELKLSRIKKSAIGRKGIIRFLSDPLLRKERAKVFYFHKKYMALSKIIDLLVENLAHRDGVDLYKNGGNIAVSNFHYYCIPAYYGEVLFHQMLSSFVRMFRERTAVSINYFYDTIVSLYEQCQDTDFKPMLLPIVASSEIIIDVLHHNKISALDPAIPAFFAHSTVWGEQYGAYFKILHDESKPIAREQETLEQLMDLTGPYEKIGYDRRTFEFPIRSDGIEFGDSKADSRLQVADLISGSCNHWARGISDARYQDELWKELNCLDMKKLVIGAVWPSLNVTPEDLETGDGCGVNSVDMITRYLSGSA